MHIKRICGLAMVFAGIAAAQYTCGNPSSASTLMRAEGVTEQTADLIIACTTSALSPATVAGSMNIALSISPSIPVTSKVLASSAPFYTEAVALTTGSYVQGVVTGSGILFTGVPTPPCAAATVCSFPVTISNVRVNTTSLGAGPVTVSENALITAGGDPATVNPVLLANTATGIVVNGLGPASVSGVASISACAGTMTTPVPFVTVNFKENFSTAFKTQGSAAGNAVVGAWTEPMANTETGYLPAASFPLANSATRIKITFSNVPSGLTIYAPLAISSSTTGVNTPGSLQLVSSENGAYSAVTGSGALTGGVAIYEVTAQASGASQIDSYAIPFTFTLTPNAVSVPGPAITAAVQFASGASGNIPQFVTGSSTNAVAGPFVNICNTVILFPYVSSIGGFDTGVAIANTSTDTQGTTPQSGACALNFYGPGAPSTVITSPNVPTGKEYLATLSSLAPNFSGYMIANCNFQYAYGFAYVSYNLTQTNGVSLGYLGINLTAAGQQR